MGRKLALVLILLSARLSLANPVGGNTATSGASLVTTQAVSYSPTAGNYVVVGIVANSAITGLTCADNNNNALAQNAASINTAPVIGEFYGVAVAGATSYSCSWTTSRKASIAVVEYANIAGVVANSTVSTATSGSASYTLTATKNNSILVALLTTASNSTFTASAGSVEKQQTGGSGNSNALAICDITGTTAGSSLTCTATMTSTTWKSAGIELYPPQTAVSGQNLLLGVGQ